MVLFACVHDNTITYLQFTKDDLSHLYYNKDTLTFTGQYIVYKDTIAYYSVNDTDSIYVPIKTEIHVLQDPFDFSNTQSITGNSFAYFSKKTGFSSIFIRISRIINSGNAEKDFEVGANGTNSFGKLYSLKDTVSLDTAIVLGKIYQNVYKFYPPEDSKTDIRLIYFAKKYGYIKIVKTDGSKLERIDTGK
jgi:hypothetical protein